jgi:hypothetical protein
MTRPAVKRLAAGTPRRVRDALRRDPDDRWAAAFGRIAGYSFGVALVTGVLLLPYFHASMAPVVYHGSYRELDGVSVSRAFQSVLAISFDIRGGLLVRQVHHWSADIFVAAVCLRLLRAFFLTRMFSLALADRRRDEQLNGRETGRIVMNPEGGYSEIREPAPPTPPLAAASARAVTGPGPDDPS